MSFSRTIPINAGFSYQAFWFWKYALVMISDENIAYIDYECEDIKVFDDIVIHYSKNLKDEFGLIYNKDYIQCKFKIHDKNLSLDNLMDKTLFKTKESFLQRAFRVYKTEENKNFRITLISSMQRDQKDIFFSYLENFECTIKNFENDEGIIKSIEEHLNETNLKFERKDIVDFIYHFRFILGKSFSDIKGDVSFLCNRLNINFDLSKDGEEFSSIANKLVLRKAKAIDKYFIIKILEDNKLYKKDLIITFSKEENIQILPGENKKYNKYLIPPIYVHFLDNELYTTLNIKHNDNIFLEYLSIAVLSTNSYLYVGLSSLWETLFNSKVLKEILIEWSDKYELLKVLTNHMSFDSFIKSKQNAYNLFNKEKYICYIMPGDDVFWVKHIQDVKGISTTEIIKNNFKDIINANEVNDETKKIIYHAFSKRRDEAITIDFFKHYNEVNISIEEKINGLLAGSYCKRYLEINDGCILKNIPYLGHYENKILQSINDKYQRLFDYKINSWFFGELFFSKSNLSLYNLSQYILSIRKNKNFNAFLEFYYKMVLSSNIFKDDNRNYYFIKNLFAKFKIENFKLFQSLDYLKTNQKIDNLLENSMEIVNKFYFSIEKALKEK